LGGPSRTPLSPPPHPSSSPTRPGCAPQPTPPSWPPSASLEMTRSTSSSRRRPTSSTSSSGSWCRGWPASARWAQGRRWGTPGTPSSHRRGAERPPGSRRATSAGTRCCRRSGPRSSRLSWGARNPATSPSTSSITPSPCPAAAAAPTSTPSSPRNGEGRRPGVPRARWGPASSPRPPRCPRRQAGGAGSAAVCAYSQEALEEVFEGKYKELNKESSRWTVYGGPDMSPRPGSVSVSSPPGAQTLPRDAASPCGTLLVPVGRWFVCPTLPSALALG